MDRVIGEEQAEADHLLDVACGTVAMLSPSLHLAVVADSATAVGVTRFMVEEAGFSSFPRGGSPAARWPVFIFGPRLGAPAPASSRARRSPPARR